MMSKLTISIFSTGIAAVSMVAACSRGTPTTKALDGAATSLPFDLTAIDRAEDMRRADQVPSDALRHHDPIVRRRAARAFARILDADETPLLRALEDEDDETMAWAAYGLGESCKAHEEARVRALAARFAFLDPDRAPVGRIDARIAIARSLGRCGGDLAEQTLRAWLERSSAASETAEAAAYALADVAVSRGALAPETQRVLLRAAERARPLTAALYPFARANRIAGDELASHILGVATATLARPAPERIFAVRVIEKTGDGAQAPLLGRLLASDAFTPAERAEAARALTNLGEAGQSALADALASLIPHASERLAGAGFGVLLAATQAVGDDPTNTAERALRELTRLPSPPDAAPSVLRRVSALRCAAAAKVARVMWDSDIVRRCDVGDGELGERALLSALDRAPLVRQRREAWLNLARQSRHVRVREAAIDAIARHPELGDAARGVLADALAMNLAGVVTTAAQIVTAHPARVYISGSAAQIDPLVSRALEAALARPWPEHLVETRVALVDAALAIGLEPARRHAEAACRDANVTVRARAAKALALTGEKTVSCPAPAATRDPAPEIGRILSHPARVVLETDAGRLGVRFDPALAPIAATRLVALARSGFYTGVRVHRVVSGFVVQLGDPEGDGYGGSGALLRCETSPVAFAPLDVGVALAGRDTGSSQIFITLARYPNLDGLFAWVGHAEGDWNAAAEGDVIQAVHVDE